MFELVNQSPWQAALYAGWSATRKRQTTLVVKAAWHFDKQGETRPMETVPAIEVENRYRGDPLRSSLAAASESVPFKQGSELLCYATAYPPETTARVMEVKLGLQRGGEPFWHKTLRVTGPRRWLKGLFSNQPGEAAPLEPLPLCYEYAYGGRDSRREEICYESNPVGQGFSATSRPRGDLRLPQIEIGPDFLSAPTQRPTAAGFGPIAEFWQPRAALTPKFDEAALAAGLCPFAEDPAADLHNAAPLDQRFAQPFRGGETLLLSGLVPGVHHRGVLVKLPRIEPEAWLVHSRERQIPVPLTCDTLVIRADEQSLQLLWRGAIEEMGDTPGWVVVQSGEEGDPEGPAA